MASGSKKGTHMYFSFLHYMHQHLKIFSVNIGLMMAF